MCVCAKIYIYEAIRKYPLLPLNKDNDKKLGALVALEIIGWLL